MTVATAAMESSTAMEPAATAETCAAAEAFTAAYDWCWTAAYETASVETWATIKARTADETRAAIEAAAPVTMTPRAGADEEAIHEPVRPVIAVRGASIRSVWVVAVFAHRRGGQITRPDADSDADRPYADPNSHADLGACGSCHHASESEACSK